MKRTVLAMVVFVIILSSFILVGCGSGKHPLYTDFNVHWGIEQVSDQNVVAEPNKGYATVTYKNDKFPSLLQVELYYKANDSFDKNKFASFLASHSERYSTVDEALSAINSNGIELHLSPAGTTGAVKSGRALYFSITFEVGSGTYDLYEYANDYDWVESGFDFAEFTCRYMGEANDLIFVTYDHKTKQYTVE